MDTSQKSSSCVELPNRTDIIIVGGGTAGLVLASRISENSSIQVLVLEAGADHSGDPAVLTPGLSGKLQKDSNYDWDFQTLPQASRFLTPYKLY